MRTSPCFITLDGIDGSGKTTQLDVIKQWFEENHLPVIFTREPGGTAIGEALRQLLLNPATQVSLRTETLLMFAARAQHLDSVILPALAQGISVVSDRFTDATYAYQGYGRGLDTHKITQLEQWLQHDFQPDLTLILDVPLDVSVERIERSREKDRFEQEQADFFARVRQGYHERIAQHPQRCRLINSNRDKAVVRDQIRALLNELFAN